MAALKKTKASDHYRDNGSLPRSGTLDPENPIHEQDPRESGAEMMDDDLTDEATRAQRIAEEKWAAEVAKGPEEGDIRTVATYRDQVPHERRYNRLCEMYLATNNLHVTLARMTAPRHGWGTMPAAEVPDYDALFQYVKKNLWDGRKCIIKWQLNLGKVPRGQGPIDFEYDMVREAEWKREQAERAARIPPAGVPMNGSGGFGQVPPGYVEVQEWSPELNRMTKVWRLGQAQSPYGMAAPMGGQGMIPPGMVATQRWAPELGRYMTVVEPSNAPAPAHAAPSSKLEETIMTLFAKQAAEQSASLQRQLEAQQEANRQQNALLLQQIENTYKMQLQKPGKYVWNKVTQKHDWVEDGREPPKTALEAIQENAAFNAALKQNAEANLGMVPADGKKDDKNPHTAELGPLTLPLDKNGRPDRTIDGVSIAMNAPIIAETAKMFLAEIRQTIVGVIKETRETKALEQRTASSENAQFLADKKATNDENERKVAIREREIAAEERAAAAMERKARAARQLQSAPSLPPEEEEEILSEETEPVSGPVHRQAASAPVASRETPVKDTSHPPEESAVDDLFSETALRPKDCSRTRPVGFSPLVCGRKKGAP